MKLHRRRNTTRLVVEELEGRLVLSAPSALQADLFNQAVSHTASVATTSTNWAGYAAQTNLNSPASGAVSAVSGSWIEPSVTGSGTAYSSFWVGIDGYSSSSVEQIGTDSDISGGVASYYAWYEMYPKGSINITTLTINAGDAISASVVYGPTANQFTLTLTDTTSGKSFTTKQTSSGLQRSSAEWIAEAPSSNQGVLTLANFNKATFTNASATINNVTGPIDSSSWQNASINMVSSYTEATTSALTDSGTKSGFTVTYDAPPQSTSTGGSGGHHHQSGGWGGWGLWWSTNMPTLGVVGTANNSYVNPAINSNVSPSYTYHATNVNAVIPVSSTPANAANPTFYWNSAEPAPARELPDAAPAQNLENAQKPISLFPTSGPTARLDLRVGSIDAQPANVLYFPPAEIALNHTVYLEDRPDSYDGASGLDAATDNFKDVSGAGMSIAAVFLGAYWCTPCESAREREERKRAGRVVV